MSKALGKIINDGMSQETIVCLMTCGCHRWEKGKHARIGTEYLCRWHGPTNILLWITPARNIDPPQQLTLL
jgi:hypothetical protein